MKPTEPSTGPPGPSARGAAAPHSDDAGPQPAKAGSLADATASLAPFHTHFAHRPDWQAAADDEADALRDRSREG